MRPTIHTVAERAGVSIATVSRVLNGNTRVSDETLTRVRSAINELGYSPNASARGLVTNTTKTMALIFPKLSGPFFSELIRGVEIEASESGYHLLIYGALLRDGTVESETQMLGLLSTKADGFIVATRSADLGYIHDLHDQGAPLVMLGEKPVTVAVDSINPDNAGGAQQIVNHLIAHGYRRIAMIKGPEMQPHADERERGYRQALRDHGLPYCPELVTVGAFDERSGYTAMSRLLQYSQKPEAVFAANDQMAIGAIAAICEHGLRVPEDIALAGFDDIEPARYLRVPLTTVHQDMVGQGQLAVRMVLARINGSEEAIETKVLPTELVIRRSCGCNALSDG